MNNNLIYDIGMHNGKDSLFYLKKGFKVVGVEANPFLVEKLKENFKTYIDSGDLVIINKAIGENNGKIDFYIDKEKDDWGSVYIDWNEYTGKNISKISVETIELKDIIQEYGVPYYLKIDIEGADIKCLKSLKYVNEKPKYISAELLSPINRRLNQDDSCLDILMTLKCLGYIKYQIVDQYYNYLTKPPNPATEGIFCNYQFDGFSSGLFGQELPDNWINYDYLVYNYLLYYHEYRNKNINYLKRLINKILKINLKENSLFRKYHWYDIHAGL